MKETEIKLRYIDAANGDHLVLAEVPDEYKVNFKLGQLHYVVKPEFADKLESVGLVLPYRCTDVLTVNFKLAKVDKLYGIKDLWVHLTKTFSLIEKGFGRKEEFKNYIGGATLYDKESSFITYLLSKDMSLMDKTFLILIKI